MHEGTFHAPRWPGQVTGSQRRCRAQPSLGAKAERLPEMANFQGSLATGSQGQLLAFGSYLGGSEPIFVEGVTIEELDANRNTRTP